MVTPFRNRDGSGAGHFISEQALGWLRFRTGVCATHLELLQLLQDHVVRHVVEQPVSGGQDDVTQLDVEGRAVCRIRAAGIEIAKVRQRTTKTSIRKVVTT